MKILFAATLFVTFAGSAAALAGDDSASMAVPRPVRVAYYAPQPDRAGGGAPLPALEGNRTAGTGLLAFLVVVRAEAAAERQKR